MRGEKKGMKNRDRVIRVLKGLCDYEDDTRRAHIKFNEIELANNSEVAINTIRMIIDIISNEDVLEVTEQGLGKYLPQVL